MTRGACVCVPCVATVAHLRWPLCICCCGSVFVLFVSQSELLQVFYNRYIMWLTKPFLHELDRTRHRETTWNKTANRLVCETLAFCVRNHSYRIKYFACRNNIMSKVLSRVLRYKEKHIVLGMSALGVVCVFFVSLPRL